MLLLAEYVKQQGSIVSAMGLGKVRLRTPVPQHDVVLLVELSPEDVQQVNAHGGFRAELTLLNEDAEPVTAPQGGETRAEVTVNRRADASESDEPSFDDEYGAALPVHITVPAGMPLDPGTYCWRARVHLGNTSDEVSRYFQVVDGQPEDEPQERTTSAA